MESKLKTYTFAGGTISPGFVLSKNEQNGRDEQVLALGEYGRGSWLTNIPLNSNPENRPDVDNNVVMDTFLLNVGGQRPFFVMLRDRGQNNNSCLIRFLTVGEDGKGNGYVNRISGFRSKPLVAGHGRNNGILPDNGTWSDEVWVVHERELLRVQLAGCGDTAYAVRVRDGEPTVEPWVDREPRQKPQPVSDNGGNGKHQWRTLKGLHVAVPAKAWSPGVGEVKSGETELDAELEAMALAAGGKRAGTTTRRPDQLVAA